MKGPLTKPSQTPLLVGRGYPQIIGYKDPYYINH